MRTLDCFRASLLGGLLFLGSATPAAAQNLFTNPELDSNATGWFLFPSAVFDPAIDFAGSPTSGSIGFSQPVGAFGGPAIANQCISAVVPNATYNVSASVLMSSAPAGSLAAIDAQSYDAGCVTGIPSTTNSAATSTIGSWQTLAFSVVAAPTAQAISVRLSILTAATPGTFTVNYDHLSITQAVGVPALDTTWLVTLGLCLFGIASAAVLRRNRVASL